MLLELDQIQSGYGKLTILHDVSLSASSGEIVAVLGPNGAGKSTLLKTIAGHLRPSTGGIRLNGEPISGVGAYQVARRGVGFVPQERNVFGELTVKENLEVAGMLLGGGVDRAIALVFERFPVLAERSGQRADTLSGGERQTLAVSAALLMQPALLLLDETSAGLAPIFVQQIVAWVAEEAASGTGVVWVVEQIPEPVLEVSTRTYVMDGGQVRREVESSSLLEEGKLRQALMEESGPQGG